MGVYSPMKTSEQDGELKFAETMIPMCHEPQIMVQHLKISGNGPNS